MKFIKQNNPACLPEIREIGCFVRSCGIIAEFKTNKNLTPEQINALWLWAKKTGCVNKYNNVVKSAPIATQALRMLGDSKGRFIEVGTFDKTLHYYASIKKEDRHVDALIQKIVTNGSQGTHFRVVDKYGNLMEDPYSPEIVPKGVMYSILYIYKEA